MARLCSRTFVSDSGEDGSFRSVADIVSPESLTKVREHKRAMKAAAKSGGGGV